LTFRGGLAIPCRAILTGETIQNSLIPFKDIAIVILYSYLSVIELSSIKRWAAKQTKT
jgi:uncharacterized protein (DUF302 family)